MCYVPMYACLLFLMTTWQLVRAVEVSDVHARDAHDLLLKVLFSTQAAAGHLHPDRGVSLRFPRFIRLRPDKTPEEASGPELLVELFNKQTRRVQNAAERLGRT